MNAVKRKYDLVFGLGNACSATQTLRAADLQFLSFPFDWVILSGADDLARRVATISNGFRGWFERKDLERIGVYESGRKDIYRNNATGTVFNHEFFIGDDLDEKFPAVRAKYDRRIARFLDLIRASKSMLVLRMDRPDQEKPTSEKECRDALAKLRARYPHASFEMLHLTRTKDVPFAARKTEDLGDGLFRIAFDYRDASPGVPPFAVRFADTAAAVASFAAVRDYRTSEEKRSFRQQARLKRWAKYGATTFLGYVLARLGLRRIAFQRHCVKTRYAAAGVKQEGPRHEAGDGCEVLRNTNRFLKNFRILNV